MKSLLSGKKRASNAHTSTGPRVTLRRAEALERQAAYDKLTLNQKIALASSRRGESKRELARLLAQVPVKEAA